MKTGNPFTLTFGQKPTEFISRTEQIGKIIQTFNMELPSSKVYMIAGVRGSGKTVSLTEIEDHYAGENNWIVLRLSVETDLISSAISEIKRTAEFHHLDLGFNINLGVAERALSTSKDPIEKDAELRNLLKKSRNRENGSFLLSMKS